MKLAHWTMMICTAMTVWCVSAAEPADKAVKDASEGVSAQQLLRNGSFEELDGKGNVKEWSLNNAAVEKSNGVKAVRIGNCGNIQQALYNTKGLRQDKDTKPVKVSFRASGPEGTKLSVNFLRYTDTDDSKAPNGYTRKMHPTDCAGEVELIETPDTYTVEYTVKPNEWVSLMLVCIGKDGAYAIVDDVSLIRNNSTPEK